MINNSFIKKNKEKLMHENSSERESERERKRAKNKWMDCRSFFNKDLCSLKNILCLQIFIFRSRIECMNHFMELKRLLLNEILSPFFNAMMMMMQ